jgi:hypothetical protein
MGAPRTVSQRDTKALFAESLESLKAAAQFRRDFLNFSAPFGVVGSLTEHFLLRRYLINFLQAGNVVIRRVAESPTEEWRHYFG